MKNWINRYLLPAKNALTRLFDGLIKWSKGVTFYGLGGVPLYDVVKFIYHEMMRDNISTRANSVAFSLFIAIFPFLIFLFTLLPYIPISADYLNMMEEYISNALPQNASRYLMSIITNLLSVERTNLQSLGILMTIFFASNGVLTLMYGFDKAHEKAFKERSYVRMRLVAIFLTLIFSILFISSFFLLILGSTLMDQLNNHFVLSDGLYVVIRFIKYTVAIFLLYTGIAILYKFGPTFKKKLPFFNSGALLATMLSLLISAGFSYYVNNFGSYNDLYGSIGALIVILLWLQFNAMAILIGFEFSASIVVNKGEIRIES